MISDDQVKVTIGVVAVWAGVIGVAQNQVGIPGEYAFRRAQSLSVAAFGELTRADERVTHNLAIFAEWKNATLQVAQAEGRAKAARLQGDETQAQRYLVSTERWRAVVKTTTELSLLLSDKYSGNFTRYYEDLHRQSYLEHERQLAATRESAHWGSKSSRYSAMLNMVAVALFLLGISLAIKTLVRNYLILVAFVMVISTIWWATEVQSEPVFATPEEAMERFVDGQILSNIAYKATGAEKEALEAKALQNFDVAIKLDNRYADAYQWKGMTLLQTRLLDADLTRNTQAAQSLERAVELGNDTSVVHTNLGWAYILTGKYPAAIAALNKAVQVEPTECQARLNLGLAYLAAAQTEKANETYNGARECILKESESEKNILLTGAVQDLSDLVAAAPNTPSAPELFKQTKETFAALTLLGKPTPAATSAQITDLRFAGSVAVDGGLVDVGNTFTAGAPSVYTIVSFDKMESDAAWMVRWYLNGEPYDSYINKKWEGAPKGARRVRVQGSPLPSGNYLAEIYVAGNLMASAKFQVQAGETVAMRPYTSSALRISFNHPNDWLVSGDPQGSYLYAAPQDNDAYLFWYATVAWKGAPNQGVLGSLLSLWLSKYPDLKRGDAGQIFLGGLTQADFLPVTYSDGKGKLYRALLIGGVDKSNRAHLIAMQAPANEFDKAYTTIFDPMLRGLEIQRSP